MSFDPVPWFVGGGAQHSVEVARLLAYAATGGAEGVTGSLDHRVTELPTPGASVRVGTGSATLLNRYASGTQQSYMGRSASVTDLTVPATSGSARSDFVVIRVDDPQYGGQAPSDPTVGPYIRAELVSNVGAGATALPVGVTYPAIILARIDIPASTSVIAQSMIVDLRKLVSPRRQRDIYPMLPSSTYDIASGTGMVDWIAQANQSITIPTWATTAKIIATVSGVTAKAADCACSMRWTLGSYASQPTSSTVKLGNRVTPLAAGTVNLAADDRGTTATLKLQGQRSSGTLSADSWTTVLWDVEFLEAAAAS